MGQLRGSAHGAAAAGLSLRVAGCSAGMLEQRCSARVLRGCGTAQGMVFHGVSRGQFLVFEDTCKESGVEVPMLKFSFYHQGLVYHGLF